MRDRKKPEFDHVMAQLAGSEVETDAGPMAVIRECVYSTPYEYHFDFGREPLVEDNMLVLVSAGGRFLDRSQYKVVDDGVRVRSIRIEKMARVPQDIAIVAPVREQL